MQSCTSCASAFRYGLRVAQLAVPLSMSYPQLLVMTRAPELRASLIESIGSPILIGCKVMSGAVAKIFAASPVP
ncbi:hypothetical protein D3C84_1065690 [compost metagenome]